MHLTSYDSKNEDGPEEKRSKHHSSISSHHHKKSKKHKKHKKSNRTEKSHKKHKKSSKKRSRRRSSSSSDSASDKEVVVEKRKSGALNEKFTEIMEKVKKDVNSTLRVEHDTRTNKFVITKPNLSTDPCSLVEEITKTIQNKVLPTMEVASSGSESDV